MLFSIIVIPFFLSFFFLLFIIRYNFNKLFQWVIPVPAADPLRHLPHVPATVHSRCLLDPLILDVLPRPSSVLALAKPEVEVDRQAKCMDVALPIEQATLEDVDRF